MFIVSCKWTDLIHSSLPYRRVGVCGIYNLCIWYVPVLYYIFWKKKKKKKVSPGRQMSFEYQMNQSTDESPLQLRFTIIEGD